jgi:hypothetical protein
MRSRRSLYKVQRNVLAREMTLILAIAPTLRGGDKGLSSPPLQYADTWANYARTESSGSLFVATS